MLELSIQKDPILNELSQSREILANKLFGITDPLFNNKNIDLLCVYALLIAGINYLVLHKNTPDTTFCEIDIDNDDEKIITTLTKYMY